MRKDNIVRPYKSGEEKWVADVHKRVYAEEYNWGSEFSDYAVKVAMDFAKKAKSEREELWVAEQDGKLAGSIMLCETEQKTVGQLRLFLVEKEYRRTGIGAKLTAALLDKARNAGYETLMLWTASPLIAAIRNYEKLGFVTVEEQKNTAWSLSGDTVYEIKMEMSLLHKERNR